MSLSSEAKSAIVGVLISIFIGIGLAFVVFTLASGPRECVEKRLAGSEWVCVVWEGDTIVEPHCDHLSLNRQTDVWNCIHYDKTN